MSEPYVPPPPPPAAPPAGSGNRTLMLVLSYLGLLALVPLLVEKDDAEVQWHAKNGLVFFFAFLVVTAVLSVVEYMLPFGCILAPVIMLVFVGYLIVMILGIVKATNGERFVIPGLSELVTRL